MIKGKLGLMGKNHSDELNTPEWAFDILKQYIPKKSIIFECAVGKGNLKRKMIKEGFKVVSTNNFKAVTTKNYFKAFKDYDIAITNPPYSKKDEFLKELYRRRKPFALLMPITALEGKDRQKLYEKFGIQILFPPKRIDFNGKGNVWFYTAWFCWKLNLPKDLTFIAK